MIRRVAFKKAVFAGVLGAIAWEALARILDAAGVRVFDLVRVLGTLVFGMASPSWLWWPAGLALHAMVGAIWAIFYAYFFWSTFDVRPLFQGMVFAVLPALLAGTVMVPQLDLMLPSAEHSFGFFARLIGPGGPLMIIIGHLVYGAVLGALYVRPVGYAVGTRITIDV
jgi:hypothetical protein